MMSDVHFMFYSPHDQYPLNTSTLELAQEWAREYLGKKDSDGETVTKIDIYRVEKVDNVEVKS